MFPFVVLTNLLLLASYAFAAPAAQNVTTRSFVKRDAVCGADFRTLVNYNDCLPNKRAFTLTPPSRIVERKLPDTSKSSVPDDMQCDHTIELQLLDRMAQQSGLCNVLTALVAADPSSKKATLLGPAAEHISSLDNLNFLDASVNNQKKTVIQRTVSGKTQGSSAIDKAVGNYLSEVKFASEAVAATLDEDVAAIMKHAEELLKKLPDGKNDRDKQTVVKKNLKEALAGYDDDYTVTAAWREVLKEAPHS